MIVWDPDNPLDLIAGETNKANKALRDYVLLGDNRSLSGLVKSYQSRPESIPTKQESTLKKWSTRYRWQGRIADYERLQFLKAEADWEERRKQLKEEDWTAGNRLRQVGHILLAKFAEKVRNDSAWDDLGVPFSQIARTFEIATQLQRLAVGEPTERVETIGMPTLADWIQKQSDQRTEAETTLRQFDETEDKES